MMTKITPDQTGCWLSGHMGWHNAYRIVDLAEEFGFKVDDEARAILDRYRANEATDDDHEAVTGQRGIADEAFDYLDGLTTKGCHFERDMGALTLFPCEEMEGYGTNDGCDCDEASE